MRLYEVLVPLKIKGRLYERGEVIDFTGGPVPKALVEDGTLLPCPERAVVGGDLSYAVSRKVKHTRPFS